MITLKHISINKYKCFETVQEFEIDDKVTVLVGKNESGKTAVLEAIAKTNYFSDDPTFSFESVLDYPRKEKKKYDKSGEVAIVVTAKYEVSKELFDQISEDIGDVLAGKEFEYLVNYNNKARYKGISVDRQKFFKYKFKNCGISQVELKGKIFNVSNTEEIQTLLNELGEEDDNAKEILSDLKTYFSNEWEWEDPLSEYVVRHWLKPHLPKFLYYSEYYSLPSRIDLIKLRDNSINDEAAEKTSKALFELADIQLSELISSDNFEKYISELEATSNEITQQLFKYWTTNKNLRIHFQIDKKFVNNQPHPILDIRVEDQKHMVSLPLKNRSKGFNWFFSFIVWFSKIQEDEDSDYILLLDEPGLSLHASAQEDLLNFIETLSSDYQVIFTTHSPFMIDSEHLYRVRTVLDTQAGTRISDSIKEDDPDTLFPLQAALGYDIAQNLFISKNNLLVEGPADLLYLTIMSAVLQDSGRKGLNEGVTIVPVGGLDKVSTFISLLKGSKLNVVCFLDSFRDNKGKQKVDDLIKTKIIKSRNIRFANEFAIGNDKIADLEDLFAKEDFIKIFNGAFSEHNDLKVSELDENLSQIIPQINKAINKDRFNHYRPAYHLVRSGVDKSFFLEDTLNCFENLFKEINKLF